MELGNNIKELRKQKGLRQEQLAEAMGVSTASVSKWETNQSYPELTLLAELADFFEVSIDTLIGHSLNADRLEALIAQMEKAANDHEEEIATALCEKILRNYPNNDRAVEACSSCYYKLFIHTDKKVYMERCIVQTKRLMCLKQGEPDRDRLERIHYLGNQYGLLKQWDMSILTTMRQPSVISRMPFTISRMNLRIGSPMMTSSSSWKRYSTDKHMALLRYLPLFLWKNCAAGLGTTSMTAMQMRRRFGEPSSNQSAIPGRTAENYGTDVPAHGKAGTELPQTQAYGQ